jgi:hypothetical protein
MQYEPYKVRWTSLIAPIVFSSKYETTNKIWGPVPLGNLKAEWAVLIMAGKNKNREIGGISQNPPLYPDHNNPE